MSKKKSKATKTARFTAAIDGDLMERVKNCVWHERSTIAGFTELALTEKLEAMESERGGPYPERGGELRAGRPMK